MDENSRVLPSHYYRDPAEVLQREQLRELGCKGCVNHVMVGTRVGCTEPRKTDQKGIPRIGIKCKFYKSGKP